MRARGSVDRATGSGPVDRGFESLRAHFFVFIDSSPIKWVICVGFATMLLGNIRQPNLQYKDRKAIPYGWIVLVAYTDFLSTV